MKNKRVYRLSCIFMLIAFITFISCLQEKKKQNFDYGDLKVMTEEDFKKLDPKFSDEYGTIDEEFYAKSLFARDKDYADKYLAMQALYRKALEGYICREVNLGEIDQMIIKAADNIGIRKTRTELYRKYGYMRTDYIYLRNIMHIERLSDKELQVLYHRINNEQYGVDEELEQLVRNTLHTVIPFRADYGDHNIDIGETCYAAPPPYANVKNNSLILILAYEIVDSKKYEDGYEDFINSMNESIQWSQNIDIEIVGVFTF